MARALSSKPLPDTDDQLDALVVGEFERLTGSPLPRGKGCLGIRFHLCEAFCARRNSERSRRREHPSAGLIDLLKAVAKPVISFVRSEIVGAVAVSQQQIQFAAAEDANSAEGQQRCMKQTNFANCEY